MKNPLAVAVVTCFITRGDKILLLKRSSKVGTYQGKWSGVSGYLESSDPQEQAWTELREELGITPTTANLEKSGYPLAVHDAEKNRHWKVFPFRFVLNAEAETRLDWEHVESRWVKPDAIRQFNTVPGLWETWQRVKHGFNEK